MQFTKIVHLIGGEKILITEKECDELVKMINEKPEGFVKIQNSLINKLSVAYIGNHDATADIKKLDNANLERKLKLAGRDDVLEKKKLEEKRIAIESAMKQEEISEADLRVYLCSSDKPAELMTAEESARGDAEYWVDELGEKHYS
jgi:hypothetical protein